MASYSVMVARFPYGGREDSDVGDFLFNLGRQLTLDDRVGEVLHWKRNDTPIDMCRNNCLGNALRHKVDYVLWIDSDMKPNAYLAGTQDALGLDPYAKDFWDSSWHFLMENRETPSVIAAPYCGPPPHENVYIFKWTNFESDSPNFHFKLEQYEREEVQHKHGIERVAALPTGLMILDMRAIAQLPENYTYYDWETPARENKSSTEDVALTRDLALIGTPVYCNWDAWCGHWKRKCVGKPNVPTPETMSERFHDMVLKKYGMPSRMDTLINVGGGNNGSRNNGHPGPDKKGKDSRRQNKGRRTSKKARS